MYRLEDWYITGKFATAFDHKYLAPEQVKLYLTGKVYGHERYSDGFDVRTSAILEVNNENRVITTYNGSKYLLGKPSESYVNWCAENNVHVPTDKEPIKLHKVD